MRHLVTGGSGFIGALVVRRLRERGEQAKVLDIRDDPLRAKDVEFLNGSVLDRACVGAAMRGVDIVHHNAALVAQSDAGRAYWEVNVEGTRIVAEEAARARVRAIVHLSTTAVYGIPPAGPITAKTPPRPIEPYGRSKLAAEGIMAEICERASIPLVTIRRA
jgi:nucleoside-diphosphate-sugar epimerase